MPRKETVEYDFAASENIEAGEKTIARNICFKTEAGKEYKIYRKILVTAGETKAISALGSYAEEKAKHVAKWHAIWDTSYIEIGGTHPASEGGACMVAVFGFAGLEIKDGEIVCNPHLPKAWKSMKFKINYKGDIYKIAINGSDWSVTKQ